MTQRSDKATQRPTPAGATLELRVRRLVVDEGVDAGGLPWSGALHAALQRALHEAPDVAHGNTADTVAAAIAPAVAASLQGARR